jgi:hypothetical protein
MVGDVISPNMPYVGWYDLRRDDSKLEIVDLEETHKVELKSLRADYKKKVLVESLKADSSCEVLVFYSGHKNKVLASLKADYKNKVLVVYNGHYSVCLALCATDTGSFENDQAGKLLEGFARGHFETIKVYSFPS